MRDVVPFDVRVVHVWTLAAGRVARFEPHIDTPRTIRALAGGKKD